MPIAARGAAEIISAATSANAPPPARAGTSANASATAAERVEAQRPHAPSQPHDPRADRDVTDSRRRERQPDPVGGHAEWCRPPLISNWLAARHRAGDRQGGGRGADHRPPASASSARAETVDARAPRPVLRTRRPEVAGRAGAGCVLRRGSQPSASGIATSPTATAIAANGAPRPTCWPRIPPTAGPTMTPTEEHVTVGPRREPPPPSKSASHAMPEVHTTPKATPNTTRPSSSAVSDGAACSTHETHEQGARPQRHAPGAEPVGGQARRGPRRPAWPVRAAPAAAPSPTSTGRSAPTAAGATARSPRWRRRRRRTARRPAAAGADVPGVSAVTRFWIALENICLRHYDADHR